MFGKGRGYNKPEISDALADLMARYRTLVFDHALNPAIIESLEQRLDHARAMGRDAPAFLAEEEAAFQEFQKKVFKKTRADAMKEEARRRRLAGESFADKVLGEYRRKIDHYPQLDIHPDADYEVARLYGALDLLDKEHWTILLNFLRKAFPGAGQLDRMTIEQRFWRFVSTRQGRMPEELEAYHRALSLPSASHKASVREAQETIKNAAFFLHELLDLCEQARAQLPTDDDIQESLNFIKALISDFRLKDLKRR